MPYRVRVAVSGREVFGLHGSVGRGLKQLAVPQVAWLGLMMIHRG